MIVGLLARPVALALIAVMLVAIKKVHARHGFFLNWSLVPAQGHGYEFNLALIAIDRKSTRLNSSHLVISYAVFCLKKKKLNKLLTAGTTGEDSLHDEHKLHSGED